MSIPGYGFDFQDFDDEYEDFYNDNEPADPGFDWLVVVVASLIIASCSLLLWGTQ